MLRRRKAFHRSAFQILDNNGAQQFERHGVAGRAAIQDFRWRLHESENLLRPRCGVAGDQNRRPGAGKCDCAEYGRIDKVSFRSSKGLCRLSQGIWRTG